MHVAAPLPILLLGALLALAAGGSSRKRLTRPPRRSSAAHRGGRARAEFDAAQLPGTRRPSAVRLGRVRGTAAQHRHLVQRPGAGVPDPLRGQAVAEAFRELWLAALSRREDWPAFRAAWSPSIKDTTLRCAELERAPGHRRAPTRNGSAMRRRCGAAAASRCRRMRCAVRDARREGRLAAGAALGTHRQGRRRMATGGDAQRRARPARGRTRAGQRLRRVLRRGARARADLAEDRSAAAGSPRRAWRGWRKSVPQAGRSAACRSTRRRSASPKPTAAACCTRPRCGRWRRTNPNPRAASTPCPTSAYDDKPARMARARSDGALGLARRAGRDPQDGRQAARRFALDLFRGAAVRADRRQGRRAGAVSRRGAQAASSTASSPPTASTSRMRCARGSRTTATRRRPRSRAIRRSCARWRCTGSIAAAGRNANGTTRCRASTTPSGAWRSRSRRTTAGSTARCSRSARRRQAEPDELRLYELRFPLHHDATIRREAAKNASTRPGSPPRSAPRACSIRTRARGANAMGLMQVLPGTGMAVARKHRRAVGRRRQPVRPRHQHHPRHRLPAPAARQVRRPALLRHRRLQRRPRAARALAVAAPGHGSGFLDRDHQLQGNPRLRRARARLQHDLRLAPQRRRGAAARPHARPQRRRAQAVRLPAGAGAEAR